jgi:hypothetical protein
LIPLNVRIKGSITSKLGYLVVLDTGILDVRLDTHSPQEPLHVHQIEIEESKKHMISSDDKHVLFPYGLKSVLLFVAQ